MAEELEKPDGTRAVGSRQDVFQLIRVDTMVGGAWNWRVEI